jgi:hypothetical protein
MRRGAENVHAFAAFCDLYAYVADLRQQLRHKCGVVRHGAENVRAFAGFCGLYAYVTDLQIRGVKVGIRGLLNWTAENVFLVPFPWPSKHTE